jgi:hypothetical protein
MWLPLQVTAAQGATYPTRLTFNNASSQSIGQLRDCQLRLAAGLPLSLRRSASAYENEPTKMEASKL